MRDIPELVRLIDESLRKIILFSLLDHFNHLILFTQGGFYFI